MLKDFITTCVLVESAGLKRNGKRRFPLGTGKKSAILEFLISLANMADTQGYSYKKINTHI